MLSLLAQASPPAEAIKLFVEIVAWIAGAIAAVAVAWAHLTGKSREREITPQPLEVKAHAGTVTRGELDQVHGRIKRERDEINAEIRRIEQQGNDRMGALEEKIDANTSLTAELSGKLDINNQQGAQILQHLLQRK